MPIYEYRCERGHTFEVMQRMTDDPLTSCSTCDAPVQRVFHPVAVHFKGSGFYSTDYGKKKSAASTDSASAKSESGESKDSKDSKKADSSKSDS
jgi:putative FmdB family regulatory protein